MHHQLGFFSWNNNVQCHNIFFLQNDDVWSFLCDLAQFEFPFRKKLEWKNALKKKMMMTKKTIIKRIRRWNKLPTNFLEPHNLQRLQYSSEI